VGGGRTLRGRGGFVGGKEKNTRKTTSSRSIRDWEGGGLGYKGQERKERKKRGKGGGSREPVGNGEGGLGGPGRSRKGKKRGRHPRKNMRRRS